MFSKIGIFAKLVTIFEKNLNVSFIHCQSVRDMTDKELLDSMNESFSGTSRLERNDLAVDTYCP